MEEKEIWMDIKGYEGMYQVSNLGRVRSLDRLVQCMNGMRMSKGRILKQGIDEQGYHHSLLSRDGKHKMFLVHRLVYAAFNGEIPEGFEVNHLDECKDNNALSNLNLLTPKENANYGTRNQRFSKKLERKVVMDEEIEFDSITKAARYFGCSISNVSNCCRNITHTVCGHTFRYK